VAACIVELRRRSEQMMRAHIAKIPDGVYRGEAFVDSDGVTLAEVALKDSDGQLWKVEVMLPDRNKVNGINPAAIVATQASARRIAEFILLSTIVTR